MKKVPAVPSRSWARMHPEEVHVVGPTVSDPEGNEYQLGIADEISDKLGDHRIFVEPKNYKIEPGQYRRMPGCYLKIWVERDENDASGKSSKRKQIAFFFAHSTPYRVNNVLQFLLERPELEGAEVLELEEDLDYFSAAERVREKYKKARDKGLSLNKTEVLVGRHEGKVGTFLRLPTKGVDIFLPGIDPSPVEEMINYLVTS